MRGRRKKKCNGKKKKCNGKRRGSESKWPTYANIIRCPPPITSLYAFSYFLTMVAWLKLDSAPVRAGCGRFFSRLRSCIVEYVC